MKILDKNINKIAVFRALQLGDLLCAIPAIRAVRSAFPLAKITLIGLPDSISFVKRFSHYFDDIIVFPGYPGLPEQDFDHYKFEMFLLKIRQENFDLILQMQGNGSIVNNLIQTFNAKCVAGFCQHSKQESELFMTYPNYGHETSRHLLLTDYLGISSAGNEMEFPLNDQDRASFKKLNLKIVPGKYICIHPGSRGAWRQWPPLYFANMADYCADQGYEIIITGTKGELTLANEVAALMKFIPVICSGKTDLGSLGVLISQSFALIANCTGVSHIAAALQTPSIIISMDGEPERWAPVNKELHYTIDWTTTPDYEIVHQKLELLLSGSRLRTASTICQDSGSGNSV
jgi:ADP-heptose:LPS heptosyltransferase